MTGFTSGRLVRREQREECARQRKARIEITFHQWVREERDRQQQAKAEYDDMIYFREMAVLRTRINDGEFAPVERFWLRDLLYRHSISQIDHHRLSAAPLLPPVSVTRAASRRTIGNLTASRKLEKWEEAFRRQLLSSGRSSTTSAATWLGLALWSAISRSQLCETALVKALRDRLICGGRILTEGIGGLITIRLVVEHVPNEDTEPSTSLSRGNQMAGEILQRVHHFSPDSLTLALIWRWLQSDRALSERQKTIVTIRQAIWARQDPEQNFKELDHLCRHAIWLADLVDRPNTSEGLCEIANGTFAAMGLDDASQRLCTSKPPAALRTVRLAPAKRSRPVSAAPSDQTTGYILDHLQAAFRRNGRKWPSRSDIFLHLVSLLDQVPEDRAEHLLVAWFIDMLEQSKLKVSSIVTYHARISARLIDGFAGTRLSALTASDFEPIYHSIIDDIDLQVTRAQVAGRLGQLHRFGVHSKAYALPPLTQALGGGTGPVMVRARTVPFEAFGRLCNSLDGTLTDDAQLAKAIRIACLLAWRAGLRLGEVTKLRMRDVEQSDDLWLFIVPNKFGPNKTTSARRQIPLAALLTPNELDWFRTFLATRRRAAPDQPILVDPDTGGPLDDLWLSRNVSLTMAECFGGEGWTFHHLRHSAANNLFLALEGETEVCGSFAGWEEDQQSAVVRAVLGDVTARQKRYVALATFMGHASPNETFESYIHLAELVLAARRMRRSIVAEVDLYAAALNQVTGRIKKHETGADIQRILRRRLFDWIERPKSAGKRQPSGHAETVKSGNRHALRQCVKALGAIEEGATVTEAAIEADCDEKLVAKWLANADRLAKLETKYGKSRLFSVGRVARTTYGRNAGKKLLLPTAPKNSAELADCTAMVDHLRSLWRNKATRDDAHWAITHAIKTADPSNSGVAFVEPADAAQFLRLFKNSEFGLDRWHLDLRKVAPSMIRKWEALDKRDMTIRSGSPLESNLRRKPAKAKRGPRAKGYARLHLQHPAKLSAERQRNEVKFTAPTIRYVMHMLAIVTGANPAG